MTWRYPLLVDGRREWRELHDVDTGSGALEYAPLTGGRDYIAYFVERALAAGDGRSGPLGAGTGHVLDAGALVDRTAALIEDAFGR